MLVSKEGRRRIAKVLLINNMSQRELARQLGFKSHSYIGRIISGQVHSVSPDTAARIAVKLGMPMDDLFLPKSSDNSGSYDRQDRISRARQAA